MDDKRMTYKRCEVKGFLNLGGLNRSASILKMKKDMRLTFRVHSGLKKRVEVIAAREGQSVARICEAFLLAGSDVYQKRGSKFLQGLIGRLNTRSFD